MTDNTYNANECILLNQTKMLRRLFNITAGFPLQVNDISIPTVEVLYQLCRFPDRPDIQEEIISCESLIAMRMKIQKYKSLSRTDWDSVKTDIMWWCLRLKLAQHTSQIAEALESTENKMIVEESYKDRFWATVRSKENTNELIGENQMGKLLVRLREFYRSHPDHVKFVTKPGISNFMLLGKEIKNDPETDAFMRKYYARLSLEFQLGKDL